LLSIQELAHCLAILLKALFYPRAALIARVLAAESQSAKDPTEESTQTSFHDFFQNPVGVSFKSLEGVRRVFLFDTARYG
jgi:hypothetical protein